MHVRVEFEAEDRDRLFARAARDGLSMGAFVRKLVLEEMDRRDADQARPKGKGKGKGT